MGYPFVDDIDLRGNRLLNAALESLASDPASPTSFRTYGNSTGGFPKYWNPVTQSWRFLDPAGVTDGSIPLSGLKNFQATVLAYTLDQFGTPVGPLSLGGYELKAIGAGLAATSAVRLDQMNTAIAMAIAGVKAVKDPVRAYLGATSAANMTGIPSAANADGVSLADGDQVWVPNADASVGKWVVHAGAWTRPSDWASGTALEQGTQLVVNEGTSYGGTTLRVTNTGTITVGTTLVTVQAVQKANAYAADNNTITLTGLTFSVKIDAAGWLTGSANGVAIDKTKVPGKVVTLVLIGDGATKQFTLAHGLALAANQAPVVSMVDASGAGIFPSWANKDANTIYVNFGQPPVSGVKYFVSVYG